MLRLKITIQQSLIKVDKNIDAKIEKNNTSIINTVNKTINESIQNNNTVINNNIKKRNQC